MVKRVMTPYSKMPPPTLHSDELERGFGFKRYPPDLLDLAVHIYEGSGIIIPQSWLLDYDPDYLDDFWKRLRISRVVNKESKSGGDG